jgi:hypothetical protein
MQKRLPHFNVRKMFSEVEEIPSRRCLGPQQTKKQLCDCVRHICDLGIGNRNLRLLLGVLELGIDDIVAGRRSAAGALPSGGCPLRSWLTLGVHRLSHSHCFLQSDLGFRLGAEGHFGVGRGGGRIKDKHNTMWSTDQISVEVNAATLKYM